MKKLLLFLLLSGSAFANHTCRILFLDGPDSAPQKLQLFDGITCTEVELPRMNLSKVYELAPGALNLRMLTAVPPDLKKIPVEAPSVAIPETMSDFYLIVASDPNNTVAPVRLKALDITGDKLKKGQMMWFNLTKNQIGGVVGGEKVALNPGTQAIVNEPASTNTDYLVNLSFRMPGNEMLYPLCETKFRHDPRSRSLAFLIDEAGQRTPRLLIFPDYREPPAKPGSTN